MCNKQIFWPFSKLSEVFREFSSIVNMYRLILDIFKTSLIKVIVVPVTYAFEFVSASIPAHATANAFL